MIAHFGGETNLDSRQGEAPAEPRHFKLPKGFLLCLTAMPLAMDKLLAWGLRRQEISGLFLVVHRCRSRLSCLRFHSPALHFLPLRRSLSMRLHRILVLTAASLLLAGTAGRTSR